MPTDHELSIIIRQLGYLEALLRNHGGMQVALPSIARSQLGQPHEGKLTYTDPNGEVIDVTITVNSASYG
jgi:hypothetical protein